VSSVAKDGMEEFGIYQLEFPAPQIRPIQKVTLSEVRAILKLIRKGIILNRSAW
jgi:hypothetical protein